MCMWLQRLSKLLAELPCLGQAWSVIKLTTLNQVYCYGGFCFFFKLNGENIFCRFLKEFPIFKTHCLTQKGKKKRRNVKGKEQRKRLISEIKQFYRLLRDNRQDPEHDRQITTSLCLLLLLLCFKLQKWSTALIKWWKKPTKKPKPKTWQVVTIYSHLSLLSYGW